MAVNPTALSKQASEPDRVRKLTPTLLDRQLALPTRSSSSLTSDAHREQQAKHQYARATTSVAIAVTAGVFAQVMHQSPEYEGEFQLELKSMVPATDQRSAATATPTVQADVAAPIELSPVQLSALKSTKLLNPVIQQLQKQKINLDYQSLSDKLEVAPTAEGTVQIRYRDANPQQVQAVLEQIAKQYQTYSQSCNEQACRDARWIHKQLPKLQEDVGNLQAWLQQHRQRYNLESLKVQAKTYAARTKEITQQEKDVNQKFASARQQYATFEARSNTKGYDAIALTILEQDTRYRERLSDLRKIELKLLDSYRNLKITAAELKGLASSYQLMVNQVNLEAQQVLTRYMTNPLNRSSLETVKGPGSLRALQNAIDTFSYLQILQQRQRTLKDAREQLTSYRQQIAEATKQQKQLEQRFQTKSAQLVQYTKQLATLEQSAPQLGFEVQLVAPPQLIAAQTDRVNTINQLKNNLATGAVMSALLGMGVAAVMTKRQADASKQRSSPQRAPQSASLGELQFEYAYQVNLPVDIALSKSRHLVDATIRKHLV